MIELNDDYLTSTNQTSSKGNQLKWLVNGTWYKADNNGYEGLSEYVVSKLLEYSSLQKNEYVEYSLDQAKYKNTIINVCKSNDFLKEGYKIITIKRLLDLYQNDFFETYDSLVTIKEKCECLVNSIATLTNLSNFGEYLYRLVVVDGLFLNDDRHLHNIAVIQKPDNSFDYCPIFDNGAALLSDTRLDYPLNINTIDLISSVKSKTFDAYFMDIIDALERLYPTSISFSYTEQTIEDILKDIEIYDKNIISRVKQILIYQRNKYQYFF